ncbi:MAG TPA: SIP domain-containing protein [Acidimicrobiales bacterium]
MAPPSTHADAIAARLDGVVALDLTVTATAWVLPGLKELRAHGDLSSFDPLAGQDLMVPAPLDDGRPRWRRYTVRRIDRAAGTLDLWVTTDSGGPGAKWALDAKVGDAFEAVGPRGKVRIDETAATHVFVVDTAGLAAMCAMAEAIAAPAVVHTFALLEDAAPQGSLALATPVADSAVVSTDPTGFLDEVREHLAAAHVDPSATAGYVFAELSVMRRASSLLAEAGIDPSRTAAKPYWRAGEPNEDHGEPNKS